MDDNKAKALKAALAQIEKQFGKNTIMHLGDDSAALDVDVVSTGSLGLDIALGIGGMPKGRIVEIYGPESSGKTTMTLQAIAECQKQGGRSRHRSKPSGSFRGRAFRQPESRPGLRARPSARRRRTTRYADRPHAG